MLLLDDVSQASLEAKRSQKTDVKIQSIIVCDPNGWLIKIGLKGHGLNGPLWRHYPFFLTNL